MDDADGVVGGDQMRFKHVNVTARDVVRLSKFYETVFGCKPRGPNEQMSGEIVYKVAGLPPNAELVGAWLSLPGVGDDGPSLEIFQYTEMHERPTPPVNQPGFGHISFEVSDIEETLNAVLAAGGTRQGEITTFEGPENTSRFVFVRDPEGNVLELEQHESA